MPDEIKNNDFEDFEDDEEMINPTRSALAAVAAGVLVIIAGFLVWNYLQNLGGNKNNSQDIQAILDEVNQDKDADKESTEESENSDETDSAKAEDTKEVAKDDNSKVETKTETVKAVTSTTSTTYGVNDYNSGDIKAGKYVVKEGDTLWEIAEAVYGTGFNWQQIADANPSLVYTLANGNVGIDTGVTLTIPALK